MVRVGDLVRDKATGNMGLVTGWYCLTRGYAFVFWGWNKPGTVQVTHKTPVQEAYLEVIR